MAPQPRVFIPDLLARWPYPSQINTDVDTEKESATWLESFGAFSPETQHALRLCNASRYGSLCYPLANRGHLRAGCDFISCAFVIEEYTDMSEPSEVQKQKDIVMDALRNPHKPRPEGEWVGGEVHRQFWERVIQSGVTEQSQKRFVAAFDKYLEGVVQQAIDRSVHHIRDTKTYFGVRRSTIAAEVTFTIVELPLDIPDEVHSHSAVQEIIAAATDMIIMANDIMSYNKEQSSGDDDHSIITVVMKEFDTDVNGAMLWVQDYHTKAEERFHAAMAALPKLDEPLASQLKQYCDGVGHCVRGNYDWHFESERYFGNKGAEIMRKRWMSLMPKRQIGKVEVGVALVHDGP